MVQALNSLTLIRHVLNYQLFTWGRPFAGDFSNNATLANRLLFATLVLRRFASFAA